MSLPNAYIRYYRENRILKNSWIVLIPFKNILLSNERYQEIKSINRDLVSKHTGILQNFLLTAETDFEKALLEAVGQINDPTFLSDYPMVKQNFEIHQNNQYNTSLTKNEYHQHNTSNSTTEIHNHPVIKEDASTPPSKPAKGKEEGVFSKKQMLLLFDLLAKAKLIEPIDLNKPNKFPAIAALLHAITGHSENSWNDELKDYRGEDLYAWEKDGERMELIRNLTNIADKFKKAGLKTVADLADKKLRILEKAAR